MAETSKFYEGTTVGDATSAPYSGIGWGIPVLGNFVIPTYLNELLVEGIVSAGSSIKVNTGACACNGQLYINDDVVNFQPANAANNRIDRIVVRSDGANDARLVKVEGTAAAVPSKPSINSTDTPLAWIWVPSGFNAAADSVRAEDVHDERIFRQHGPTAYDDSALNLMYNSEFLAVSGIGSGDAPEGWYMTAPAPTLALESPAAIADGRAKRGNFIRFTADAGEGIETKIRLAPGMYTLRGLIDVDAGVAAITLDGVTEYEFNVGLTEEFVIRHEVTSGDELILTITADAAASDFRLGQIALYQGYVASELMPKHELIMLDYALTDVNWTAVNKTTGNTTIDLSADFGGLFDNNRRIRGAIVRMLLSGSSSSTGIDSVELRSYNGTAAVAEVRADLFGNNDTNEGVGYVNIEHSTPSFRVYYTCNAGQLTITLEIIGIVT